MAALLGKRARTTQPLPGLAQLIDWSNPITRDLSLALSLADAMYGYSASAQTPFPYSSGAQANTPQGTGGRTSGAPLAQISSLGVVTSPNYSLFAFGTCTSVSVTQSALDMDNSSTRYFQFRVDLGKADFIPFNTGAGNTGRATSPVAMTVAEMSRGFTIGATASPTRTVVYQNGTPTVGAAVASMIAPGTAIPLAVGSRTTGTQSWATGGLMLVAAWMRTLSDAEMASLADNPWQIFKPQARRQWVPRAVSAAYVLQAAAGAFLMSASQAALSTARRLVAAAGALTSGWAPASLVASRRLPASSAAFTMTGSPASIKAARKIAADVGTFGLVGTAAPMIGTRRLTVQTGAFVLSPGTVQMVYTPAAEPGGPTYILTTVAGEFALAAGGAAVLARRRLGATSGAFVCSGAEVPLLAGRRLSTIAGTFAVTGAGAELRAARCVPAQTGTFGLAGADAQLKYSAQVTYARAPAGGGYVPQQHYNESRPAVNNTARPAALQRNYR